MKRLLIQYPVRAVWNQPDGSDAHIVDAVGNVLAEGSVWVDPTVTADEHRGAMVGMAIALNAHNRRNKEKKIDERLYTKPGHL